MTEKNASEKASKIIEDYEIACSHTKSETIFRLINLSSEFPPKDFISILPTEFIEELCNESLEIPANPNDIIIIGSFTTKLGKVKNQEIYRKMQSDYYSGLVSLHKYFHTT